MSEPEFIEKNDPEEAFTVLSDDTRVAILRALWDVEGKEASFSALRDAVGMADSGQFNYHLDKLVGRFVAKTDEGYELTRAGMRVNGAIESGAYTGETKLEPITLEDPCPTCGGERTLTYADETVSVECESCSISSSFPVPPSVLMGYDREEIPAVTGRYLQTVLQQLNQGFCWYCDGRIESSVGPAIEPDDEPPEGSTTEQFERMKNFPIVTYECQRCGVTPTGGLRPVFLDHPAVAAMFYDHGISVRDISLWEDLVPDVENTTIRSQDPFRGSVTFSVGDDAITITVNENLDIVDIEES